MPDTQTGEQNKHEIESHVENQSAYEQLVFTERELPLYGNPWRVKQVRNRESTL